MNRIKRDMLRMNCLSFGREATQPGVGCAYALRLSPVKVISPGYPVVFVSRTARCSGTVLFNDSPQSGKLMKHSPVTITPLARIHG